ncbi:MAG: hypothetical protein P4L35_06555 [Ignavibacteriaceae bacterium]|nr:hypothetical protein [Ignavibacteriaceae bacterium]
MKKVLHLWGEHFAMNKWDHKYRLCYKQFILVYNSIFDIKFKLFVYTSRNPTNITYIKEAFTPIEKYRN